MDIVQQLNIHLRHAQTWYICSKVTFKNAQHVTLTKSAKLASISCIPCKTAHSFMYNVLHQVNTFNTDPHQF